MAVHLEDVIEQTGGCGRYQIILSLFIHLTKSISCFSMVFMVFGGASPDWWCTDGANGTSLNTSLDDLTAESSSYKSCKVSNSSQTCMNFVFGDSLKSMINEVTMIKMLIWVTLPCIDQTTGKSYHQIILFLRKKQPT